MPEKEIREVLSKVKTVVVPELNLGQIAGEIKKVNDYGCKVIQANRVDGILITPEEIIAALQEGK
jgi:2-oxoglutarate ferredoxin oxidoreductase subunit alpha